MSDTECGDGEVLRGAARPAGPCAVRSARRHVHALDARRRAERRWRASRELRTERKSTRQSPRRAEPRQNKFGNALALPSHAKSTLRAEKRGTGREGAGSHLPDEVPREPRAGGGTSPPRRTVTGLATPPRSVRQYSTTRARRVRKRFRNVLGGRGSG